MSSNKKEECWNCDGTAASEDASPLMRCTRCQTALYCSRDCQVAHWKTSKNGGVGHKKECAQLQAKKIQKGEQKATSNLMGTFMNEHTLAVLVERASRMASDPDVKMSMDRRAMLQSFSREMEPVLAMDLQARCKWMSNPENCPEFGDVMDAMIPANDAIADFRKIVARGEFTGNPHQDNTIIVHRYFDAPLVGSKPKSMVEIVQAVEPVLDALDAVFQQTRNMFSSSSAKTYLVKLRRLKAKVQEYNSMKTSDQRAYTQNSLFQLQEMWKQQVKELFTIIVVACVPAMEGPCPF